MITHKRTRITVAALLAAALAACSSGGGSDDGAISVSLMDRPVDGISELNITVTEFWIKPQGNGPAFQLDMVDTPVTVNLLELSAEDPAVMIDRANIPQGTYNWIEMTIDDSDVSLANAVTNDGLMEVVEIDVPSDRVRLINNFDVEANESVRLLFDWDVRKGLTEAVGRGVYILKPVIRVLEVEELGSITGEISASTIMNIDNKCNDDSAIDMDYSVGNVVYVFEEATEPDEMGVVEPITTVEARDGDNDGDYEYRAVLMPGSYVLAATCQAGLDSDEDDELDPELFFLTPSVGDGAVTFITAGEVAGPDF